MVLATELVEGTCIPINLIEEQRVRVKAFNSAIYINEPFQALHMNLPVFVTTRAFLLAVSEEC